LSGSKTSTPREVPGSADRILRALDALELHWDGPVRYQGSRIDAYRDVAESLWQRAEAFYCRCSRRQLRARGGSLRYPGTCRDLGLGPGDHALRLRVDDSPVAFVDGLQGAVAADVAATEGDFVIVRRDALPAYHLAAVVDDADQGVSDVVRGIDLLDCTPPHIVLQRRLGLPTPRYWHIPMITDRNGEKLSKRTGAAEIDTQRPGATARRILELLGHPLPAELGGAPPGDIWAHAIADFRFSRLAARPAAIPLDA